MKTRTKLRRAHSPVRHTGPRPAVEMLEARQYFALYQHDIDSLNTGKGMWAWTLSSSMSNDGYAGNPTGWLSYLKNTMHLNYIITKAGDGSSQLSQYTSTFINQVHAAGLKIFPYFYIYGTNVTGEANVFNNVMDNLGGDGAIIDIESEYGNNASGLTSYFGLIGRTTADYGTGSGAHDKLFLAYSTFDNPRSHQGQVPYAVCANYCDAAMPQMYWKAHAYTITNDISIVDSDYKNTGSGYMGNTAGIKPVIPTGQTYDAGNGLPSATETNTFYNAIKNDTNAVGPNGTAGFRYKGINYFDEHTTTAALRTEIAAETIGDLPGAAAVTSPANGAGGVNPTNLTLNWSDVVNTFGTGSVGAALYYDVYVDNMSTPLTTISYSAPNAPVSQYTLPTTLAGGSHQWKVVARNMFGSTTSPTWTFSTLNTLPGVPVNLSPADGTVTTVRPVTLDWNDVVNAVSYDIWLTSNPSAPYKTGITTSTTQAFQAGFSGNYSWYVAAKNAAGDTVYGPVWTVTVDTTAPTAALLDSEPSTGDSYVDFGVTYTDPASKIDWTTLDANDVTVTGPDGAVAVSLVSISDNVNSTNITAVYRFAARGGFWNDADNGSAYTVTQVAGQVKDVAGNARAAGSLGTLTMTGLGTAWLSGTTLNVAFDGSTTPVALSTNGTNIAVTKNAIEADFDASLITDINVVGSSANDRLQINAPLALPMTFADSTGNDLLELNSGTYTFSGDIGTPSRNLGLYVASGATAVLDSSEHLRSLSVDGTATVTASGGRVLWVTDLAVTGKLNLNDNDLIWDYSGGSPIGAWASNAYSGLTGLITQGRNGGGWNGNGLVTSQSNAMGGIPLTNFAVAEASDVLNYTGATALFDFQTVDTTAVLVKYTYTGDADLNGRINGDDYLRIDMSYQSGVPSYLHGDFNLDGRMNADDYFLIDYIYLKQGTFL